MKRRPGRDDVNETKPPGRRRSVAAAASTPSTAVRPTACGRPESGPGQQFGLDPPYMPVGCRPGEWPRNGS
ncbi:hypothetical protein ACWCQ1_16840 [Streptomyces sp. NPDC002144]